MDREAPESDFTTIPEYIARFPEHVRGILEELRRVIRETAREAEEAISWGMPTFRLHGNWCISQRISIISAFIRGRLQSMLSGKSFLRISHSKGTVRFPIDKPIPFDLVRKIVRYRVKEHSEKGKMKI